MPLQNEQSSKSTSPPAPVVDKAPDAGRTRQAVSGKDGFDAQAAALVPPAEKASKPPATLGPDLKSVQERLNTLGYDCGKADGVMGPKTQGAIVAFQRASGLVADGILGPMTRAALEQGGPAPAKAEAKKGDAGSAPKESKPATVATVGNGPQLKAAQESLNKLGFSAGTPDGVMGPMTKGAIEAFQKSRGLAATGSLDTTTLDKLSAAAAAVVSAPPVTTAAPPGGAKAGKEGAEPGKDGTKDAAPKAQPGQPPSGARQAVAAAAYAEVGKVRAKETTAKDDEGKPARVGWDRLVEYFNVSFGGAWKDIELLKRPRAGTKLKHGTTTGERVETSDTLISWCGIFALWAVKAGGMSVGNWGIGKAAPNILKGRSKVPQVGDIVVSSNNNHHAVVVWVAPDAAEKAASGKTNSIEIKTVDGNSGSNPVSGGEVVDKGASTMAKWNYGAWTPE